MIHDSRVQPLNDEPADPKGRYVLYWMQASQRVGFNHALEYAVGEANARALPVVVCFGLMDGYPEANERHYAFMLEGLADVAARLRTRRITFVVKRGGPPDVALHFAKRAALVVCDRGYLRHQRQWRDAVADGAGKRVVQVEGDVVVPVETASDKDEFAARTIRPKITKRLSEYIVNLPTARPKHFASPARISGGDIDVTYVARTLAKLKIDRGVKRVRRFVGGESAARKLLAAFVRGRLTGYDEGRNEPAAHATSTMSPYLHFGQISPVEIALRVRDASGIPVTDRDAYIEELIVRRELSVNHVFYNPRYDSYDGLPDWAKKTLAARSADKRYHVYTRAQFEAAETHDPWWNAAQREMVATGFMHNYMRMYWGKKILEWTRSPRAAFETTLYLNNKYFLDGRDPNAYANVAWIFGLHDRPWGPARPVFGTVRYMNAAGLERKFDMEAYVRSVDRMTADEQRAR
jgi:deoxyribodipyrimidine photo-lyase